MYSITRPFGAAAQAGFGIGMRVIQAGFMPVVALGFSVAPVAGQNFGARQAHRVKDTFKDAALMATGVMVVFAILCHIAPAALVRRLLEGPGVIAVGDEYLRIISWNFVASGLIFVASSMFQAMGNTIPSLVTSGVRIVVVAIPAILLSRLAGLSAQLDLVPVGALRDRAAGARHAPAAAGVRAPAQFRAAAFGDAVADRRGLELLLTEHTSRASELLITKHTH